LSFESIQVTPATDIFKEKYAIPNAGSNIHTNYGRRMKKERGGIWRDAYLG
jgi:hypothetical protein